MISEPNFVKFKLYTLHEIIDIIFSEHFIIKVTVYDENHIFVDSCLAGKPKYDLYECNVTQTQCSNFLPYFFRKAISKYIRNYGL